MCVCVCARGGIRSTFLLPGCFRGLLDGFGTARFRALGGESAHVPSTMTVNGPAGSEDRRKGKEPAMLLSQSWCHLVSRERLVGL